jgi:hypothetical protein
MSNPTISYGGTTLDLGLVAATGNRREIDERVIVRRTLDGHLRTSILSHAYRYVLAFPDFHTADYDALVTLWRTATAAGAFPSFDFHDVWPSANGVTVGLDIGPLDWTAPADDSGSFTLTLTETEPR